MSDDKDLSTFFDAGDCPDCGHKEFSQWQDGGHDVAIECQNCGARFGVQLPPFNMIERIGRATERCL